MPCVRHHLALICSAILLAGAILTATSRSAVAGDEMSLLRRWLAAVNEHQPGRRDGAVARIGAWPDRDLDAVTPYIELLVRLLRAPAAPLTAEEVGIAGADLGRLRELARAEMERGDLNRIAKRGALLHADIMMSGAAARERLNASEAVRETRAGRSVAVLGVDGEQEGFAAIPPHWALARLILDGVHPDPSTDDFVRLWYRATTAYMLQRGQWGDAERQLRHARERLTPDAGIHLDSGCLYEAFAAPRAQSMMSSAQTRGVRLDMRPVAENLRLAEMHFTQATVLDPKLLEARVRLARVRIQLGRAAEAVSDLEAMSIAATDPVVRYYAVLFLGQALEALERFDAARVAYQRAAALYPMSQAPHLALSLLARETGDRETAQFALGNSLFAPTPDRVRYDPWWVYSWGSGRSMRALVLRLWAAAPGPPTS
jgi:tetratricopeptide (TPR) repeat protein